MDINSKNLKSNIYIFKVIKNILKAILLFITLSIAIYEDDKIVATILVLMILLFYLNLKKGINEAKLCLFTEDLRRKLREDYWRKGILNNSQEDCEMELMLGKEYKNILSGLNRIEEEIYKSSIRSKQSEDMTNKVILEAGNTLQVPVNTLRKMTKEYIETDDKILLKQMEDTSYTLKNKINEIFELSKASTSNLELNIENINIVSLLNQAIAEYTPQYNDKGIKVNKSIESKEIKINTDPEKLWRVLDILFGNIEKHSKENTRVYIELEDNEDITMKITNISNKELNISKEEFNKILSEQQQLGICIARSLLKVQGANLDIDIDGDMFSTIITFSIDNKSKGGDGVC